MPMLQNLVLLREPRYRRAAMTAGISAISYAASLVFTFVSTPLLLHHLGATRFGLLTTLYSLSGLFAFADLGVGYGLMTTLAEKSGLNDIAAARRLVSCALIILLGLAAGYGVLLALVLPFVPLPVLLGVPPALGREASLGVLTVLAMIVLAVPIGIGAKVQAGYQRGYLSSMADLVARVVSLAGVLLLVQVDSSVPLVVLAVVGVPVAIGLVNVVLVFGWQFQDLRPRLSAWSWPTGMVVLRKGSMFVVLQTVLAVAFASDNLVITQLLGPAAVAVYAVPRTLFQAVSSGSILILLPLWPAYGEALAKGDVKWVSNTLLVSLALMFVLATLGCTVLVVFTHPIFRLWLHSDAVPPTSLLLGFAVWVVATSCGGCLSVLMNAAWAVRFQLVSSLVMGAAALVLKILLGRSIGLSGVIWGTDIAYIGCSLVPSLVFARRWVVR